MKGAKAIAAGDAVQVQRLVGKPWEAATYRRLVTGMRGWHHVELTGDAVPVFIDSMTGAWLDEIRNDRTYTTRRIVVPSRRLRRAKEQS